VAMLAVHPSPSHPAPSALVYVERDGDSTAWLGSPYGSDRWARGVVGADPAPASVEAALGWRFDARKVDRVALIAPSATLLRDTIIDRARRVVFRVNAAPGTVAIQLKSNARVSRTAIDARVVDTTRFRGQCTAWTTT